MAFLEFVIATLALLAFCRGVALLMVRDKLHKRLARTRKGEHSRIVFTIILACVIFAVVTIGGINTIDMVVLLFASMIFMACWAIREAHRGTHSLWKAYHMKEAKWKHTLGCLLISGSLALVTLLLIIGF